MYLIHSDYSFGDVDSHLHSTTRKSLWIFYLIVQLDYTINRQMLYKEDITISELSELKITCLKLNTTTSEENSSKQKNGLYINVGVRSSTLTQKEQPLRLLRYTHYLFLIYPSEVFSTKRIF